MDRFRLVRLLRTLSSEIYLIWQAEERIGQADIHYGDNSVQANLFLEAALQQDQRDELLRQLDEDIVSSYLPSFDRDQFIVTIFVGDEVDSFNYPETNDELGGG